MEYISVPGHELWASPSIRTGPTHGRPTACGADHHLGPWRRHPSVLGPSCTQQRSEEHTSELQSRLHLVCRLLLEKKKNNALNRILPSSQHTYGTSTTQLLL